MKDAFPPRTDEQHRQLGEEYRNLSNPTARKNFVKAYATRFTQLSRLPYFDIVSQVVVDPMHNLFLGTFFTLHTRPQYCLLAVPGLVKTHFYQIWVQNKILRPNHELRRLHELLPEFTIPVSCGKLPTDIGMPSGGSLTADQWLLLVTVYGPIVIPQLWQSCLSQTADKETLNDRIKIIARQEAEKNADSNRQAANAEALKAAKVLGKEALAAEKARIAQEKAEADQAKKVERERVKEAKKKEKVRVAAEKRAQRQNGKGKNVPSKEQDTSIDHNEEHRHVDGDEDDTDLKFKLHHRDPANFLKLSRALRFLMKHVISDRNIEQADQLIREYCAELIPTYQLLQGSDPLGNEVSEIMLKASSEERGTVAGLAALSRDLEDMSSDVGMVYGLSPRRQRRTMSLETYELLARTISLLSPSTPVHCRYRHPVVPNSIPLDREALFFDYVVVHGKRYYASRSVGSKSSSLVQVTLPSLDSSTTRIAYGEILEIIQFDQDIRHTNESMWFARVRWFKKWSGERESIWDTCESVGVRLWELEEYETQDTQLPSLIPPGWIGGQLALKTIVIGGSARSKVWATISLAKVRHHLIII
ncbi:hypothetical protein JVU11DRAFT_29 [Chiua virens]|nr:hypothetical protein JVU11DRAFT_29 [Chiua virens]